MRSHAVLCLLALLTAIPSCAAPQRVSTLSRPTPGSQSERASSPPGAGGVNDELSTTDLPAASSSSPDAIEADSITLTGLTDPITPPSPVPSQNATRDGSAITLATLQQMALASNPTLRQANAVIRQNRGNQVQVGLYPNPTIGYMGSEIGMEGTAGMQGGFVSQTFVTAGKLDLNRAVASRDVQAAGWTAEAQRLRVLNDVEIRYVRALGAQRAVEIAEELHDIAQEGVRLSEQLFENLQTARTDVLQAQMQLGEVEVLLENSRTRAETAWKQLAILVGDPDLPPQPLEGELETLPAELDLELAWQQLAGSHPLLQVAWARVERARCQLRREQVDPVPDVQVMTSVQHDAVSGDVVWGPQVGITLPVFNRNQGNIAAAVAELHRSMDEVARLELALRDALAVSYQNYRIAGQRVRLYRDQILPRARESLDLVRQGYELGEFEMARVLVARRSYFEANVDYVNALVDLRSAAIEINGLLLRGGLDSIGAMDVGGSGQNGATGSGMGMGGSGPVPKSE